MIDHPEITERLIAKLNEALPIPARLTPELQVSLRGQNADTTIPAQATITWISYAGDEGGIVCKLDLGPDVAQGDSVLNQAEKSRLAARLPPDSGCCANRVEVVADVVGGG
jgi:hypothetical protein